MQWARTWWNCGGGSQPSKKPRSWWSAGTRDRADTAFSKTGTAGRGCQEAGIQERPECRASYSEFRSYRSAVGWAKPTGPAGACHRAGQRPDPLGRPDDRLRVPTKGRGLVGTARTKVGLARLWHIQSLSKSATADLDERAFAHPTLWSDDANQNVASTKSGNSHRRQQHSLRVRILADIVGG